ncbi:hypothetical protein [Rathayibacter sp. SD072]|uniref:hypothetical protein n=1 Tax=Rathayibacter sp. SD072 TaxID=2781731 RepID=UPI001A95DF93|nr:hypothetical protein [Rathayibacter sp. SD072]MBO0985477.1 hypothetical protein [Rathayibacter sp. SD072]
MTIRVEESSAALLELLWVRERFGLAPVGDDLPPLLVDPPTPATAADRVRWQDVWPELWRAALDHAAAGQDPSLFERLILTADGSAERADLLARLIGPRWGDRFDPEVLGEPFEQWRAAQVPEMPTALEDHPERRDLVALVPAWRAGLTMIVTVPCRGEWSRRIGTGCLLTTAATRADSASFRRALSLFSAPAH